MGLRAWLWAGWLLLALCALGPRGLQALDPLGLDAALAEVRSALDDMASTLNAAPQRVQITMGADLHLMSRSVSRALDRLQSDAVPIVDPALVYDLDLLADIVRAATEELRAAAAGGASDPERAERIDRLSEAASARLVEVNLVIDGWTERSRNAVVEFAEEGGALVLRSTDRTVYNGIRYTGIALLLVGLLVVGVQLLRMSEERVDSLTLLRETPVLSTLAIVALSVFFAGCVVFSARPGMLAALSAEVRSQPQEHPCERLAAQRERLAVAQQVESPGLIAATKERMLPAAKDCLGLPSEAATAEALDLLAAKTAVAWNTPRLSGSARMAMAPADLEPGTADMAVLSLRADDAEPADTEGAGLAEPADAKDAGLADPADAKDAGLAEPADAKDAELAEPAAMDLAAAGPLAAAAAQAEEPAPAPPSDRGRAAARLTPPDPRPGQAAIAAPALAPPEPRPALAPPEPRPALAPPEPRPAETPGLQRGLDGARDSGLEGGPELYVTTSRVNYRAGPSLQARRLGTFIIGAELEVVSEDGGWAEVRLSDGREVWVASEFLKLAP